MSERLQSAFTAVNSSKSDLLSELQHETVMGRRQELLKAIWRLEHGARPVAPPAARPKIPEAVGSPKPPTRNSARVPDSTPSSRGATDRKQTLAGLNELYAIERFSLANYLRDANPWISAGDQRLGEAIRSIAERQLEWSQRLGALIIDRRSRVENRSFPSRFTAYNDLALAYLAHLVMEDQERIVQRFDMHAPQFRQDAAAYCLVQEILTAERAHLDILRELIGESSRERLRTSAVAPSTGRPQQDAHVATAA